MPGKPIEAQLYANIEAAGGWETVWDRVANGETQTAIAASLGISQGFLSRVIHLDQARVRAFREAKRRYAVTLVEHTGELVKQVKENRDAIAKVREQANHGIVTWEMASRRAPLHLVLVSERAETYQTRHPGRAFLGHAPRGDSSESTGAVPHNNRWRASRHRSPSKSRTTTD